MQHRILVFATALALTVLPAGPAQALGVDDAVLLIPGTRAVMLRRFVPAAGPLERHTSRPGAWYALLYLAMTPEAPVRLRLWSAGGDAVLTALDAPPDENPAIAHRLPLEADPDGPGGPARQSRFMLPVASQAPGIFVLVEIRRPDGERPASLWVQLAPGSAPRYERAPVWAAAPAPADKRLQPPPSPLTQQAQAQRGSRAYEVPILMLPPAPETGGWR